MKNLLSRLTEVETKYKYGLAKKRAVPDKKTRDNSWPGENAPPEELPPEIRNAALTIKDCLDPDRKLPDLCMEVVNDLLFSTNNAESLLGEEMLQANQKIVFKTQNPPFLTL